MPMVVLVLHLMSINLLKEIDISAKANSHPSHSQSQDVDYFIDATENKGQSELNGNW